MGGERGGERRGEEGGAGGDGGRISRRKGREGKRREGNGGGNVRDERVRNLVASKGDVAALEQAGAQHVAESVVFLVEGEEGGGWDACFGAGEGEVS